MDQGRASAVGLALAFFHQSSPKDLGLFASRYVRMRSSLRSYAECLGKDLVVEGVKFCSVDATKLRASPGRNLVFIYLESFENALTEERLFPGLTPNIAGLRKEGWTLQSPYGAELHYSYGGCIVFIRLHQTGWSFSAPERIGRPESGGAVWRGVGVFAVDPRKSGTRSPTSAPAIHMAMASDSFSAFSSSTALKSELPGRGCLMAYGAIAATMESFSTWLSTNTAGFPKRGAFQSHRFHHRHP
jgi:hypothetical protein